MDRREFFQATIATIICGGIGGPLSIAPAKAQSRGANHRSNIKAILKSMNASIARKNYEAARRKSVELVRYSHLDPNWYTYSESFQISMLRLKFTPEEPEDEWLKAAQGVVECFPGMAGDMRLSYRALAKSCYGLLQSGIAGRRKTTSTEQAGLAMYLLLFSGIAPGPERVEWAKAARNGLDYYDVNLVEGWEDGGMGYRLSAVGTGISGDWEESLAFYERMFADPESRKPAELKSRTGARGFGALFSGRESLEAEAACAYAMAGRLDDAMALFERSRRNTPFYANRKRTTTDPLSLERELLSRDIVVVNLSATFAGSLVIVSQIVDGELKRTVSFDSRYGGIALQSRTVNSGAIDNEFDGLMTEYQSARGADIEQRRPLLQEYVTDAATAARDFAGATVVEGLSKAGIGAGADVLLILPASLAFLPISISPVGDEGGVLGQEWTVRYADSLAAAVNSDTVARKAQSESNALNLIALDPDEGGPEFTSFEVAGIAAVSTRAGLAHQKAAFRKRSLQWPDDGGYWHVSSHAAWNFKRPERSGVMLGRRRIASVKDILKMTPASPPRLVFLSACETALLNTKVALDHYRSLPTAFLAIGAGGVIASHWPVSDAASALLSTKFYEEHLLAGKTPVTALQAAQHWLANATTSEIMMQITTLASNDATYMAEIGSITSYLLSLPESTPFRDPYYWGGFQLYGA